MAASHCMTFHAATNSASRNVTSTTVSRRGLKNRNASCSLDYTNNRLASRNGGHFGTPLHNAFQTLKKFESHSLSRGRGVVTMVIPFQRGAANDQPPPDLASYLFKNRIVFLGMALVPAVTELILAELLYLQYDDKSKPIYMYINSTGITKDGEKLGYETEAFAVYDTMQYVSPPIFTLAIGNAWGEAALLLAAGAKGNRSALPSATIMIKQPIARFRGQATDLDIQRKEIRAVKAAMVKLYSKHFGHPEEKILEDILRPKYFTPEEAVEYGIIDKVIESAKGEKGNVVDKLRKKQLI